VARTPVSPIDPAVLEKMKEETSDLLGRAPEDMFTKSEAQAASIVAAGRYQPPDDAAPADPEDLTLLLNQAFQAIGRQVPTELLDQYRATHQPIVDRNVQSQGVEPQTMTIEEYKKRIKDVRRTYQEAQASVGTKRANMLRAIKESPRISYFNKEDRWMQINGVKITVPEGIVTIPSIVAREIDHMDRTRDWVEVQKRRAQQYMNIDQRTSFVPKKVERFAVY
jgi:hypothetical protein